MSARAQIELEGSALASGDSIRLVCPFCGGGSSHEKSLVITNSLDGGILFVCHRAHCNSRGRIGGVTCSFGHPRQQAPRQEGYSGPLESIPDDLGAYVRTDWSFGTLPSLWRYSPSLRRLMFGVMSPVGRRRGWVARCIGPSSPGFPKVLNYKEIFDEPWLHWAGIFRDREPIYVVEDIPSAARLAERGKTAVALMGTHAADDVIGEIADTAKKNHKAVIIALDRDAVNKAFEVRDKLYYRTEGKVIVAVLDSGDIKNMTSKELEDWLNGDC